MSESVYSPEYQMFLVHLKATRERAGLSQRDLAERLQRSYSYVAKIETGYTRMDIYQIRCYLHAVGVDFLDFMRDYNAAVTELERQ